MTKTRPVSNDAIELHRTKRSGCRSYAVPPTLVPRSKSLPATSFLGPDVAHAPKSHPASARLDARAATLRALNALCLSCWPRIHAHASKLLCALLWTCGDCSRRAKERDASEADAAPLGVDAIGSSYAGGTITAAMDENVLKHATRVGALVLLLGGESARALLADICEAVEALRPAGVVMGEIADTALRSGRRRKFADGTGERKEYD